MSIFSDRFEQLKRSDKPARAPKYLQETMGFQRISRDGIFEVAKGKYSKTYRFQDINYVTAGADDQMKKLKQYCKTVNAIDVSFKITINNRNKNMQEFRENVLFHKKGDPFDWIRDAYNHITESRIVEGKQGIEQERYLTACVERKGYEQAKAFFATFEATLKQNFAELGSTIEPLDAKERLRILFQFYRMGDEEQFHFNFRQCMKSGGDAKKNNFGGYMKIFSGCFLTNREKSRGLFI